MILVLVSKATPIQYIIKNGSPGIKNSIKKPNSFGISILYAPYKKNAMEEIIPNKHKKVCCVQAISATPVFCKCTSNAVL